MPSPRACLLRGGEAGKGRDAGSYHPTGQTVAVRVPRGLKIPREQIAEACGRWWVLTAGPKGHYHLPVKQGVVQDDTSLSSAMLPPTVQAQALLSPGPVLLGVTSAAGGGGVQPPGGGRGGRGSAGPWRTEPSAQVRTRLLLPLPQQDGTAANFQGHLTKGISSRAERQHQLLTRPETSTLRFSVGFY